MATKTAQNQTIVVLGSTGMLGSMVTHYLSQQPGFKIIATNRSGKADLTAKLGAAQTEEFDAHAFLRDPQAYEFLKKADYVINCIGIIKPHCHDHQPDQVVNAIAINAAFPHQVSRFLQGSATKLLQIATDCVYAGTKGGYLESDLHDPIDVYGKTKSLGELEYDNALNLRCSIIGPELGTKLSLLEWFLSQPKGGELTGFHHHKWNGVTTLQFAQICERVITSGEFAQLRATHYTHHFLPNSTVTKYELLNIFQKVFGTNFTITGTSEKGPAVDRTLQSSFDQLGQLYPSQSMESALVDLKKYIDEQAWTNLSK